MLAVSLWRFLRRSPWSTLMAAAGICLGVTSVVSVHLISTRVAEQLEGLEPPLLGQYSHFLHRPALTADTYFQLRRDWRHGRYPRLTGMAPVVDENLEINGRLARVIGVDLIAAGGDLQRGGSARVTGSGTFAWDGVWADPLTAARLPLPLNGEVDSNSGVVIADIPVAQQLLGWSDQQISYVAIQARDPWAAAKRWAERLIPGFGAGWPESAAWRQPGLAAAGWQVVSARQQHPASRFGKAVLFNVSALAVLAMLVAWFLIYQVAVTWLRKLQPTLQRLHLLGVGWGVLGACFISLLAAVGLVGGLLGLGCGQWLARGLYQLAVDSGPQLPLAMDGWVVVKGMGSALGVSVVGGAWAVYRSRVSTPVWRAVAMALVLVLIAGWGITSAASGLVGGFAAVAVLSVLTAALVRPSLEMVRRWSGRVSGPPLLMNAVREVFWYPRDLSVALGGLTLAVATAIGVGTMVESFRGDFERFLQQRLSYDIVVRPARQGDAAALQGFVEAQTRLPVAALQTYHEGSMRVAGSPVQVTATHLHQFERRRYLGDDAGAGTGGILIGEQLLRQGIAGPGPLVIDGDTYPVDGVFQSFGDLQARLVVDYRHPLAAAGLALQSVSFNLHDRRADPQQVAADLQREFPQLQFDSQAQVRQAALQTFDRTFAITGVLITIALLVAGIGMYVATSTLRLNQRTSSRLLTSMGVSWAETLGADAARSMAIAAVAVTMALPLGLSLGWILCEVINPRAFGWAVQMCVQPQVLLGPALWGGLAALVAGVVRLGQDEESQYAVAAGH